MSRSARNVPEKLKEVTRNALEISAESQRRSSAMKETTPKKKHFSKTQKKTNDTWTTIGFPRRNYIKNKQKTK